MGSHERHIQGLLEKTSNYDKDERYMATSDLCTELQNDVKLSVQLELKICTAVLKQLDDTSNDVQAVAVKCLSILVKKVDQAQVMDICSKLCNLILTGKAELRDIYSIGLKTALEDLPEKMGPAIATKLTSRLLGGVKAEDDEGIKLESLDILTDLIKYYGYAMASEHSNISTAALSQLSFHTPVIRKRATACLGQLATAVSDELLDRIIKTLLESIENPKPGYDKRTLIQAIGTISRMVGYRLGSHLDRIVPLFITALGNPEDEAMQNEEFDELRENILHAFESFVIRCPNDVTAHIPRILEHMLAFMVYDPNYHYNDDGDDDEVMDDDEYDEEYDEFEDDYSDEDDTSWKVRRSSIKVVKAVVMTRSEILSSLYAKCGPLLLDRFKERDENVKLDVLNCYTELVRSIINVGSSSTAKAIDSKTGRFLSTMEVEAATAAANLQKHDAERALESDAPKVVKASVKLFKDKKGVKAKTSILVLLKEVCICLRGGLQDFVPTIVPYIVDSCKLDKDSALIHEGLHLLGKMFLLHTSTVFYPHMQQISTTVIHCVSAEWYKNVAEALNVMTLMVQVLRPEKGTLNGGDIVMEETGFDFVPYIQPCFQAVMPRLETHDIDTEVKEGAIAAIGAIIARLGDHLSGELDRVLSLLKDRLSNDITRLAALKSIERIASSSLRLDLGTLVTPICLDLVQFLRQQNRTLKQHTLQALEEIVKSCGKSMDMDMFATILDGAGKLIDGNDTYLTRMALDLCVSVLHASDGKAVAITKEDILPRCMTLITSSVVQPGPTQDSLLLLFEALVQLGSPDVSFDYVLEFLVTPAQSDRSKFSKTALESLARCVACVCLSTKDDNKRQQTIAMIVTDVENGLERVEMQGTSLHLALLSLGEIGSEIDLSVSAPKSHGVVLSCLSKKEIAQEVKSAAATALGNISLGNLPKYLPVLMNSLEMNSEQSYQYLLLSSLREVIVRHSTSRITGQTGLPVQSIIPVLERHCESEEEGVRNMVAECLGKLAILDPVTIIPHLTNRLQESLTVESPLVRWTLVTTLKYIIASSASTETLRSHIGAFLHLLNDSDLQVRRAAIVAFNSIAHHRPAVIREVAREKVVVPLFGEMQLKPELKRTVDLGPFKHTVDDGLPLRKSAFACLLTILETLPDVVPLGDFFPHLAKGLADDEDVAILCHQIIMQIVQWSPHVLLNEITTILDPLAASLNKPPKDAQGGGMGSGSDSLRSALRAFDAIASVPEAAQNRRVMDVLQAVHSKAHLVQMMELDNLEISKKRARS